MAECPIECSNREANIEQCPCTKEDCARRGICCECIRSHRERGNQPTCLR